MFTFTMEIGVKKTTQLKELIHSPKLLVMPGAYDALSARLCVQAGFSAVQCSGMGIAATLGYPDVSVLSMREIVDRTGAMATAVDIPVMGDGDTGYGNAVNTWFTVREFERVGAAGVNLEDQVLPKRCGRLDGKAVVSIEEMVGKLEAAVDARTDPDFVINARTDALSLNGIDDVIKRGNAFLRAGATMFFVEGIRTRDEIAQVVAGVDGPVAINLIEDEIGAGLANITFEEIEKLGVARCSISLSTLLGAIHGIQAALEKINAWQGVRFDDSVHAPFESAHALAGMEHAIELSNRYNR